MKRFLFFIIFVLCLYSVNATPSITSSSNSLTNGQTFSVSGSSFGVKVQATPQLYDTVDNQANYSSLQEGAVIPVGNGYPWLYNGAPASNLILYTKAREQRGFRTAHYYIPLKGFFTGREMGNGNNDKFYATWWMKPSANIGCGPTGLCVSNKVIRVWSSSDALRSALSWTENQVVYETGSSQGQITHWKDWSGNIGQWNRLEVYVDNPSGLIEVYTNGVLIDSINNIQPGAYYADRIWRIGMDPSIPENLDPNLIVDFGEIYEDNTPARVEICSGSSWINKGHCEIQIAQSWSDGSIQVQANQGTLSSGQPLYLYVIDQNNNANANGYPISFGTVTGPYCGDSTCNNGETCSSCSQDCGACAPVCGDGTCNGAETCSTCAADCGSCSNIITQTINLAQGWNLFTLRVNASTTSSSLQSLFVMRYENNQWQTAWNSGSAFNLEPLRAYYVYSTRARTITITGTALNVDYNYPLKDYSWNLFAVNRTATFNSIYSNYSILQQELDRINSGFSYTQLNVASSNLIPGEYYWVNIRSPQNSPAYTTQVRSNNLIGGVITFIYHIFS